MLPHEGESFCLRVFLFWTCNISNSPLEKGLPWALSYTGQKQWLLLCSFCRRPHKLLGREARSSPLPQQQNKASQSDNTVTLRSGRTSQWGRGHSGAKLLALWNPGSKDWNWEGEAVLWFLLLWFHPEPHHNGRCHAQSGGCPSSFAVPHCVISGNTLTDTPQSVLY